LVNLKNEAVCNAFPVDVLSKEVFLRSFDYVTWTV